MRRSQLRWLRCGRVYFIVISFIARVGLMSPVTWLLGALNSRLGHLYQPFNIRVLHLTIIMSIVLILFFAVRRDLIYFAGFHSTICFHLHSDTNRRIHIHGGVLDAYGCTLLLFHFIDHNWVRIC